MITSDLVCQDGNRTLFLKLRQELGSMRLGWCARGVLIDVEEGSNPDVDGVTRALSDCVIPSSRALDTLKKSNRG